MDTSILAQLVVLTSRHMELQDTLAHDVGNEVKSKFDKVLDGYKVGKTYYDSLNKTPSVEHIVNFGCALNNYNECVDEADN